MIIKNPHIKRNIVISVEIFPFKIDDAKINNTNIIGTSIKKLRYRKNILYIGLLGTL